MNHPTRRNRRSITSVVRSRDAITEHARTLRGPKAITELALTSCVHGTLFPVMVLRERWYRVVGTRYLDPCLKTLIERHAGVNGLTFQDSSAEIGQKLMDGTIERRRHEELTTGRETVSLFADAGRWFVEFYAGPSSNGVLHAVPAAVPAARVIALKAIHGGDCFEAILAPDETSTREGNANE